MIVANCIFFLNKSCSKHKVILKYRYNFFKKSQQFQVASRSIKNVDTKVT